MNSERGFYAFAQRRSITSNRPLNITAIAFEEERKWHS